MMIIMSFIFGVLYVPNTFAGTLDEYIDAESTSREAEELIHTEKLNEEAAKRYILNSLKREYASEKGTELNEIIPKMSPLNPQYLTKKQSVLK